MPTGCATSEPTDADVVAGVAPRTVARPESVAEVAEVLRACHADGRAVVVRGRGSKLGWGVPPERLDVVVDVSGIDDVVEHAAGDLIVTVGAGCSLAELGQVLARERQQLVVDDVIGGASVGGVLATGLAGPRRLWAGAPRDLVIGLTMVRADGTVARAGGKVVKNVAGYDLGKLLTGSYGTLGVIAEATFRLHPVPETTGWVTRTTTLDRLDAVLAAVRHSQIVPVVVEIDDDGEDPVRVAVAVSGTTAGVTVRRESLVGLLGEDAIGVDTVDWVGTLAPGAVLLKATTRLSGIGELVAAARAAGVAVRGSAGVGVVHGTTHDDDSLADRVAGLRTVCHRLGGSLVVLSAAPEVARRLGAGGMWGPVDGLDLMRRVKHEFDPTRILSPGRFVGGL